MEDKRTRSDYIREIEKLNKVNRILEKSNIEISNKLEGLKVWLEDELWDIKERVRLGNQFLGETKGNYTLRMYLVQQKNTLVKVSQKMKEL